MTELDFSNLPFVSINDKNQLPSVSAVYIVFGLDRGVVSKVEGKRAQYRIHECVGTKLA